MAKVNRAGVSGILLPDDVSETLLRGSAESSLIQQYGRAVPMQAQTKVITEAEVGNANVFWVGEGNRKSTDAPSMSQKTWSMAAAEIAVIIPLDENVADDASVDLFDLYKAPIETAIAHALDAAAIFGTDKPTAWGTLGTSIVDNAVVAGTDFEMLTAATAAQMLNIIAGTGAVAADGAIQSVEDDGYEVTGALAHTRFKARLRAIKDLDERPIFGDAVTAGVPATLFGTPISFAKSDVWDGSVATAVLGDWAQALVGTKQGVRYKVFDQGVISDGAGNIVYSLMENDMIALRVTARYAFKVIADDTADGETLADGDDFPFAVITPEA